MSHRQVTRDLLEDGKEMLVHALQAYRHQPSVSLMIDAGTILRRRFLDLVLLSAHSTIRLFLYDAVERNKFGIGNYGGIARQAVIGRRVAGVKSKSIVGGNHPIQVRALAHWSQRSFLKNRDPEFSRIRFQACIWHVVCLVMADAFAQSL
jgi:hypothetical protein